MVISGDSQRQFEGMFRFDNYLTLSPDFIPSVQNIWQHEVIRAPMYAVIPKLKALKPVFREQRQKKGNLTHNVQLAKGFQETAQTLANLNRQDELFIFLEHCCRLIYSKAVKLEQIMLQQRGKMERMKGEDQCSRVFFRRIAQRRTARRILQINDAHGTTHTEPNVVSHEFVAYHQSLLGGVRRREVMDFRYMRPWAQHVLSDEKASQLVLPFMPEDMKLAVFDIADDKAPGPDFTMGRLLKQINSLLSALIPKGLLLIFTLFRVRLSVVLDKLISPCQPAFIPGRSIGDNIMLAQELFTGYNQMQLPRSCELKVDIRKAYDTVVWDFLLAVLQLFGFLVVFMKWIEECVTTTSFSVGMNGKSHGFFTGARGLRQGGPLLPYLFVLVMEVKHLPSRLFQLGFAGDHLLFCRCDIDSIRVFKEELDQIGTWTEEQMLAVLRFQEGLRPMTYLGLPLISSKLRVQIIKSVLTALSVYWASAFILLKEVIKNIEKRLRIFLWKGKGSSGYAKVAWKEVCKPLVEGGQGLRDISTGRLRDASIGLSLIIEARGVRRNWSVCKRGYDQWWNTILEMEVTFISRRIHGIISVLLWRDSREGRSPLVFMNPSDVALSSREVSGSGLSLPT
ncbi:UNVERIFIED_CONTAM: hypothetical protein Sindi_0465000 [Sesamum indicum]